MGHEGLRLVKDGNAAEIIAFSAEGNLLAAKKPTWRIHD
jgi:hypothetical protein